MQGRGGSAMKVFTY